MSTPHFLLRPTSREEFLAALERSSDPRADKFAGTFRAKADAMGLWPHCAGIWEGSELCSAIIVRCSKRLPRVGNLQLLHTFSAHRRKGHATRIVRCEFRWAVAEEGAEYFRVSSEPEALPFYRALGFRFWGEQKSGSSLSIFKVNGPTLFNGIYDPEDPVIKKAVFSKARGGVVELSEKGPR